MWFNPTTSPVYTAPIFTPNSTRIAAAPSATLTTASKTVQPTPTAIPNPNDDGIQDVKSFLFFCALLVLAKFASWIGYGIANWFFSLFTSGTKQSEATDNREPTALLETKQNHAIDHKELIEPLKITIAAPTVKKSTTSKISSTLLFILRATIITCILLCLIKLSLTVPMEIADDLLDMDGKVEAARNLCENAWKGELCQDINAMRFNG